MGAAFEALDELLDESITLPVPGGDGERRLYTIPSPPAADGLLVERVVESMRRAAKEGARPDMAFLDDDEERDLYRTALGPAYDEMVGDGVTWAWTKHAAMTAIVWVSTGTSAAERYWKAAGGRPEPQAPENRAARRAAGTRQGSSPAAKSTRSRGSRSTTSTPRATARKPREETT